MNGMRNILLLALLAACAPLRRFEAEQVLMGTKARIIYYAADDREQEGAGEAQLVRRRLRWKYRS